MIFGPFVSGIRLVWSALLDSFSLHSKALLPVIKRLGRWNVWFLTIWPLRERTHALWCHQLARLVLVQSTQVHFWYGACSLVTQLNVAYSVPWCSWYHGFGCETQNGTAILVMWLVEEAGAKINMVGLLLGLATHHLGILDSFDGIKLQRLLKHWHLLLLVLFQCIQQIGGRGGVQFLSRIEVNKVSASKGWSERRDTRSIALPKVEAWIIHSIHLRSLNRTWLGHWSFMSSRALPCLLEFVMVAFFFIMVELDAWLLKVTLDLGWLCFLQQFWILSRAIHASLVTSLRTRVASVILSVGEAKRIALSHVEPLGHSGA